MDEENGRCSEWNGRVYLEYPHRSGVVYEAIINEERPVRPQLWYLELPDDVFLICELGKRRFWMPVELNLDGLVEMAKSQDLILLTTKVFHWGVDRAPVCDGSDWPELLWKVNAAAATNNLFHIRLTPNEYRRLVSYRWNQLLSLMSPRTRSLIQLHEDFYDGGYPGIELLRGNCRCP
jgi:hypothetical protein